MPVTPGDLHVPRCRASHRHAARQHQRQRAENRALVAKFLADRAAGQGEYDARRKIEPDQDADIGNADAELVAEQRCHRRHALKLERHGGANREQNGKDAPAIAQSVVPPSPLENRGAMAGACQSARRRYGIPACLTAGPHLARFLSTI
jgi:hypothetical protein